MIDNAAIEQVLNKYGLKSFRWISAQQIVVSQWVRFKCIFGCASYNTKGSCPPNVPSVIECERFFSEYKHAIILHLPKQLENPDDRHEWSKKINRVLVKIEREVFLLGHRKAFVTFMDECALCDECNQSREDCLNKKDSRPGPEALAVDVFETVRKHDFPIEVLTDTSQRMNRYAFLLVD